MPHDAPMGSEQRKAMRATQRTHFASLLLAALALITCVLPSMENRCAAQGIAAGRESIDMRGSGSDRALNSRGFALLGEKRCIEAAGYFRQAIALNPARKEYDNNLAAALMNQGDYAGARLSLESALALDAAYPRALATMAVCCFHLHRFRESYRYYRMAIEADARYAEERFDREKVRARVEDLSRKNPGDGSLRKIASYLRAMPPERPAQ